jgi:hypothetical protein
MSTDTARDIADGIVNEHYGSHMKGEWLRDAIASALTAYGATLTAREALEAARDEIIDLVGDDVGTPVSTDAVLRMIDRALSPSGNGEGTDTLPAWRNRAETAEAALAALRERHPEPDGVVEEPPRDNSITDAW